MVTIYILTPIIADLVRAIDRIGRLNAAEASPTGTSDPSTTGPLATSQREQDEDSTTVLTSARSVFATSAASLPVRKKVVSRWANPEGHQPELADMVTVVINSDLGERREFKISRALACKHSKLFELSFGGESCLRRIILDSFDYPEAFEWIYQWMQNQLKDIWKSAWTEEYVDRLFIMWVLSKRLKMEELCRVCLECIYFAARAPVHLAKWIYTNAAQPEEDGGKNILRASFAFTLANNSLVGIVKQDELEKLPKQALVDAMCAFSREATDKVISGFEPVPGAKN